MRLVHIILVVALLVTSVGTTLFLHFAATADGAAPMVSSGIDGSGGSSGSSGTGSRRGGSGGGVGSTGSEDTSTRMRGGFKARGAAAAAAAAAAEHGGGNAHGPDVGVSARSSMLAPACADLRRDVRRRFAGEPQVAEGGELACSELTASGRYERDCVDVTVMAITGAAAATEGAAGGGDGDSDGESENVSGTLLNGRTFGAGRTNLLRLRLLDSGTVYGLDCRRAEFVFFNRPPAPRESAGPTATADGTSGGAAAASAASEARAGARAGRQAGKAASGGGGGDGGGAAPLLLAGRAHGQRLRPAVAAAAADGGKGSGAVVVVDDDGTPAPSLRVHAFYYPWYGNPATDGGYKHWNHEFIPHWDPKVAKRYPPGRHDPAHDDVAAAFFPKLGAYSSGDPATIESHMRQMRRAGVGVAAMSWYPAGKADDNGGTAKGANPEFDRLMLPVLDAAQRHGMEVAVHIEPYEGRDHMTVRNDLRYIADKYLYDSYRIKPGDWAKVFGARGKFTVRGTTADVFLVGLAVERKHLREVVDSGFDGVYTYFAADQFSFGSSPRNWGSIQRAARAATVQSGTGRPLAFIPSVGPGYIDTGVRPWNTANTKARDGGRYYEDKWLRALAVRPEVVSVTSFNEWHEGSQIEEAVPMTRAAAGLRSSQPGFRYLDYQECSPRLAAASAVCGGGSQARSTLYLDLTRFYADKLDGSSGGGG